MGKRFMMEVVMENCFRGKQAESIVYWVVFGAIVTQTEREIGIV